MGFYDYNLVGFVLLISAVGYYQWRRNAAISRSRDAEGGASEESTLLARDVNWQFKRRFLPVYLLVMGADWLQVRRMCFCYLADYRLIGKGTLYIHDVQGPT